MSKITNLLLMLTLVFSAWAPIANAANPYSAAYSVNDSIITHYDITERVKLLQSLGAPATNLQQTAIDQLIDDRLKLRAARTFGLAVNNEALINGLNSIAAAQNTTADAIWSKARGRGVSRKAFDEYFTVQLIWRALVQRRFSEAGNPTSIELDNAVNVAATATQTSILLAEIALPFAERGEEATIAFADRLANDLNKGANFEDAVQRFSRSATAQNKGQIGWLSPELLPAAIQAEVLGLGAGQVSRPVTVSSGVIILKVVASRTLSSPLQKQVAVTYAVLDLSTTNGAVSKVRSMQHKLDECSSETSRAEQYGPLSGLFGPVPINEVPADVAVSLARLTPGKSEVITNGDNVLLVQLCDRTTDLPDDVKAQLANGLLGEKLSALADGYLLELRRAAIIERR